MHIYDEIKERIQHTDDVKDDGDGFEAYSFTSFPKQERVTIDYSVALTIGVELKDNLTKRGFCANIWRERLYSQIFSS